MERIKKLLRDNEPLTWVFYGDSITHGVLHTFGHRDYAELFAERIRFELDRPMDLVITSAVSGDTSSGLLSSFDWRVARFDPDVVFLMIGMNDCSNQVEIGIEEFEKNLLKLADRLGDLGAALVLQTTCPILPGQAPDRLPYFDFYMDAIRKVSDLRKLPLIDHTQFWQEHGESHFLWMSDAFHPNAHGHRVFARQICRCLDIYDEQSRSCQLCIP